MGEIKSVNEMIQDISPYYKLKKEPEAEHQLVYDSSSETLEPIYFWILDIMNDMGLGTEKLVDNFTSTPGGTHFSEVGMKASKLQDEAMKILANANAVMRSVLNITYDLKDFKTRLLYYNDLKSDNKDKKEAARLSLKQIWLDKVDFVIKGNSSIKAMALGQAGYQTLIDAFLIANEPKDVEKMDLNDRVKRILIPRVQEFNVWLQQSEIELKKRYEIEKNYLKSQVSSLKLYSQWAKPYLRAIKQLEMKESGRDPSLVNIFNTIILELSLFGKSKINPKKAAIEGTLPIDFKKLKFKRDYYSCILIDFRFRAIPRQGGVLTGRTEVSFRAYALNEEEIKKLSKEIDKSYIDDFLSLLEGTTTESLEQIKDDIESFLNDKVEEKPKGSDDSNPFAALFGFYEKSGKKEEKEKKTEQKNIVIKPDDWIEKEHLRKFAAAAAEKTCFTIFETYKKAHGMPDYGGS